MLIIFLGIFTLLSIFVPYFFTRVNLIGLSLSVTSLGMVGTTMLFALAAGDLDLSVGSTMAFTGVLTAVVINASGSVFAGFVKHPVAIRSTRKRTPPGASASALTRVSAVASW